MVDNRNPFSSFLTVIAGQKIPCNKLDISSGIEPGENAIEAAKVTRGPNEAAEICKAVFEKFLDDSRSDETIGSRDQNTVVQGYNVFRIHAEASAANKGLDGNKQPLKTGNK